MSRVISEVIVRITGHDRIDLSNYLCTAMLGGHVQVRPQSKQQRRMSYCSLFMQVCAKIIFWQLIQIYTSSSSK